MLYFFAATNLLRTRFELWLLGYRWTGRLVATRKPGNAPEPRDNGQELVVCRDVAGVVNAVGRRLYATCLARSMTAQRMLAARGIDCDLRIGVKRDDASHLFMAHAWLESGGVVVNDDPDVIADFRVIDSSQMELH